MRPVALVVIRPAIQHPAVNIAFIKLDANALALLEGPNPDEARPVPR